MNIASIINPVSRRPLLVILLGTLSLLTVPTIARWKSVSVIDAFLMFLNPDINIISVLS